MFRKKRVRFLKGQVAIEHLMVAGFAIVIFTAAIFLYYHYAGAGQDTLVIGQAEKVVNTLSGKADEIAAYDVGMFSELTLDFPQNIEGIFIGSKERDISNMPYADDQEILIKLSTSKGVSDIVGRTTLAYLEGEITPTSGLKKVSICALGTRICIVELEPGKTCFDVSGEGNTCEGLDYPCDKDGIVDDDESCDPGNEALGIPPNLDGKTCLDFGFNTPEGLACTQYCSFDPTGCKPELKETSYIYANNQIIATLSEDNIHYYQLDATGSVRTILDSDGKIETSYDYWPFGAPAATATEDLTLLRFKSSIYDKETGLYISYNPLIGRKYQPSESSGELTLPQSFNKYTYKMNNPFNDLKPKLIFIDYGKTDTPQVLISKPQPVAVDIPPSKVNLDVSKSPKTIIPLLKWFIRPAKKIPPPPMPEVPPIELEFEVEPTAEDATWEGFELKIIDVAPPPLPQQIMGKGSSVIAAGKDSLRIAGVKGNLESKLSNNYMIESIERGGEPIQIEGRKTKYTKTGELVADITVQPGDIVHYKLKEDVGDTDLPQSFSAEITKWRGGAATTIAKGVLESFIPVSSVKDLTKQIFSW